MPDYTVTADDRAWFDRCHRAWDFSARTRAGLEPLEPSAHDRLCAAILEALAVHYFPGMWTWDRDIVDPLVFAAYGRAGGPASMHRLLERFLDWAPQADRFTPIRVQHDLDVPIPDPVNPGHHLSSAGAERVRYRDRVHLVVIDDQDRCWLGQHRLVDDFGEDDELFLDERGVLACWAWQETELSLPVTGIQYTELRMDPPDVKRTLVERSVDAMTEAAERLGRTAWAMLEAGLAADPQPYWAHCRWCPFRTPCVMLQRGEDPEDLLAERYRRRAGDELEEGRLGGISWGLGRGAAPPRF